jgi:hypothetical protein
MKPLTRRSVTTGLAAAVVAIPAVGLCKGVKTEPCDDPLPDLLGRYRAEIAAINASSGLDDDDLDAWVDKADAILVEAVALPVVTGAGAVAVLSLFVDDPQLFQHWHYGDKLRELVKASRDYIAGAVA